MVKRTYVSKRKRDMVREKGVRAEEENVEELVNNIILIINICPPCHQEKARKKLNEKIKELETSIEKYVKDAEAYNRDWDDDGVPEVDKKTLDEMISRLER